MCVLCLTGGLLLIFLLFFLRKTIVYFVSPKVLSQVPKCAVTFPQLIMTSGLKLCSYQMT